MYAFTVELLIVVEQFQFQIQVVFGRAEHEFDGAFRLDRIIEEGGGEGKRAVVGAHYHDFAFRGDLASAEFRTGLHIVVAGGQGTEVERNRFVGLAGTLGDGTAFRIRHGIGGLGGVGCAVEGRSLNSHGLDAVLVHDQPVFEMLVVRQHEVQVHRDVGYGNVDGCLVGLALRVGGLHEDFIVRMEDIVFIILEMRTVGREDHVEMAVGIGDDRAFQQGLAAQVTMVRPAAGGTGDAVPDLTGRDREAGIAAELATLPDHVAITQGFGDRLQRHREVRTLVFFHPDHLPGIAFRFDDVIAVLASFRQRERAGGRAPFVSHEREPARLLVGGSMLDRYRNLLVRKNFSTRLTRLEADDLEVDGIGRPVEGTVGQDPALIVTELLGTADIVVGIQTGK